MLYLLRPNPSFQKPKYQLHNLISQKLTINLKNLFGVIGIF